MITRLKIKNFRTLRDVDLSLRLTNVLVGPNMAGKSNLIDVLRFLTNLVLPTPGVSGLMNAFNLRNGFSEVAWKGGDTPLISISLEATAPLTGHTWRYELSILGDPRGWARIQDETLSLDNGTGMRDLIGKNNGQRVLKNLDGRVLSHLSESDRSGLEFEIPDWDGNAARRSLASWHFYRLVPAFMRQPNPTAAANFLTEHGDNLSAWLMNLQTRYQDCFSQIRDVAKDVFPELEDLFTWPTQQSTVFIASKEKNLKRPVSAWQMSDGQLAFIALLSLIEAPPDLGADLYCIEEPENYLHPRLLETLIELLRQVQSRLGATHSGQMFISTHSPQLVDLCQLDELLVLERKDGATICTRPGDRATLRKLLEDEEVGLGNLFYSGALSSAE